MSPAPAASAHGARARGRPPGRDVGPGGWRDGARRRRARTRGADRQAEDGRAEVKGGLVAKAAPEEQRALVARRFGVLAGAGIAIDNAGYQLIVGLRYDLTRTITVGVSAEYSPWISIDTRRTTRGTTNAYAVGIYRWDVRDYLELRLTLAAGVSVLAVRHLGGAERLRRAVLRDLTAGGRHPDGRSPATPASIPASSPWRSRRRRASPSSTASTASRSRSRRTSDMRAGIVRAGVVVLAVALPLQAARAAGPEIPPQNAEGKTTNKEGVPIDQLTPVPTPTKSPKPARPAYQLYFEVDGPMLTIAAVFGIGRSIRGGLAPAYCAPVQGSIMAQSTQCDPATLNWLDRQVAGRYRPSWSRWSDIGVYSLEALAAAGILIDDGVRAGLNDLVVVAEASLMASAAAGISTASTGRPRPYMYGTEAPLAVRQSGDGGLSFFSGHTSTAFAVTTATFVTLHRLHPDDRWPWLVLAGGSFACRLRGRDPRPRRRALPNSTSWPAPPWAPRSACSCPRCTRHPTGSGRAARHDRGRRLLNLGRAP